MREKVQKILKESLGKDVKIEIPPDNFGDYSCGEAFSLAKEEGKDVRLLAKELCSRFTDFDVFEKVEAHGGFVNFFISKKTLEEELSLILDKGSDYGKRKDGRTAVIDYSSPNIAKPFGIGHLRSTIIGHSIYRIYKFLGWDIQGVNHLGDWGTQFGKLIHQIKKEEVDISSLTVSKMEELYVRFHAEEGDEDEGRKWFSLLEKGDAQARKIWQACKEASEKEFEKVYKILNIEIDHVIGESFYEDMLGDVTNKASVIAKESNGAMIIEFEDMPPAMLKKSDGSTTYFARDLAAIHYRLQRFHPSLFIYEVGADQSLHMRQLFRTAEMLGWSDSVGFVHVAHGLFRMKEGKLSTRMGRTIHLDDVLKEAEKRASLLVKENLSLNEREEIAKIVGVGAVKYNDLKKHHKKNIVFDWDEVLTLKGDSGPYLQYTALRCKSVLEKEDVNEKFQDLSEEECRVVREMMRFKETIEDAAESFSPNMVASFAYRLARSYNLFYDKNKILGNPNRTALTRATFILLCSALELLTISLPKKM